MLRSAEPAKGALVEHARRIGRDVMQVVFLKRASAQGGEGDLVGGCRGKREFSLGGVDDVFMKRTLHTRGRWVGWMPDLW